MGTGGGAWLVAAIGTVAVIVVDLGDGDCDGGIRYAGEAVFRLVEFGDCSEPMLVVHIDLKYAFRLKDWCG